MEIGTEVLVRMYEDDDDSRLVSGRVAYKFNEDGYVYIEFDIPLYGVNGNVYHVSKLTLKSKEMTTCL